MPSSSLVPLAFRTLPVSLPGGPIYPQPVTIDPVFGSLDSGGSGGKYDVQVGFSWLFSPTQLQHDRRCRETKNQLQNQLPTHFRDQPSEVKKMMVRYWQPFREMDTLRRQLDGIFDEFTEVKNAVKTAWAPAIRLVDEGAHYRLYVQLPGVNAEDLDIQVTREAVVVSGDRKAPEVPEGQKLLFDDLRYGSFRRVVTLPEAIHNSDVEADFTQGLLSLTLPKFVAPHAKVVRINLAQLKQPETPLVPTAEAISEIPETAVPILKETLSKETLTEENGDLWASNEE